jgi:hypothetical protein
MSTPKDGGSAFPVPDNVAWDSAGYKAASGMTLRDWFAGQALVMSHEDFATLDDRSLRSLALNCYDLADAMLAARARGKTE